MRFGWAIVLTTAWTMNARAESSGWDGFDPAATPWHTGATVWWTSDGGDELDVRVVDGAQGEVSVDAQGVLVKKTNSAGYLLVSARDGFPVPTGRRIRCVSDVEVLSGDADHSVGVLRVLGGEGLLHADIGLDMVNVFLGGGPSNGYLVPTPAGVATRRYAGYTPKTGVDAMLRPAIVVAGTPSVSRWRNWAAEDYDEAAASWSVQTGRFRDLDVLDEAIPDEELSRRLDADVEHVARIAVGMRGSRMLIDGKTAFPALYKCCHGTGAGSRYFNFRGMGRAGVSLHVVDVKLGRPRDGERGFWTADGFDVQGAIDLLRWEMRLAPDDLFVVTIETTPYPEFADEHPDETWVTADGKIVGSVNGGSASMAFDGDSPPEGAAPWVSMMSPSWMAAVKDILATLVAELKRAGLAKRIVGVHLAGFHDNQFAMAHPDYSAPSEACFRQWMAEKGVSLSSTEGLPRFPVGKAFLEPETDGLAIEFNRFLHQAAFRVQEELARHVRTCLDKEILVFRWCMGPFAGDFSGAYDIGAFMRSKDVDVLVAQPEYTRRRPGVAVSGILPLASFARHGKLYLDEFDLRTYGRVAADEISQLGLSNADDLPMWTSMHRKLSGRLIASGQGWWYYDIGSGFFDPPEIRADIASTIAEGTRLCARKVDSWRPDVAFVIDEDGRLLRNAMSGIEMRDEQFALGEQLQLLAASGVPHDVWLAEDVLEAPWLVSDRTTVVLSGFHALDERRRRFVRRLRESGCTLVYLAGTACVGDPADIGFRQVFRVGPLDHELVSEKDVSVPLCSQHQAEYQRWLLGVGGGDYYNRFCPSGFYIEEADGLEVLARYRADGRVAIGARTDGGRRSYCIAESAGLTPELFNLIVRTAGGYVPVRAREAQVDMCGDFVSLHGLTNGVVAFKLPGPSAVRNLATGEKIPVVDQSVSIDMSVGRTCWLELTPERADGPDAMGPVVSRETGTCRADLRGRFEVVRQKVESSLEARAWTRAFSNEIIVGGTRGCVIIIR